MIAGCNLGEEPDKFWHDHKGAKLNAIRTRTALSALMLLWYVLGKNGVQWNVAFDAGWGAAALGKALVIMHGSDHQHALKKLMAQLLRLLRLLDQVAAILN